MSNPVSPSSRHGSGHPPTPPNPSPMGFDWVDSVEKLAASTILNAPKTPPRRPSSSRFREGSNRRRRHAPRRVPVEAVGATVLRGFAALSSTANPPRASFSMPPSAQSQGIDPPHDGLKPPGRPDAPGLDLAGKIAGGVVAASPEFKVCRPKVQERAHVRARFSAGWPKPRVPYGFRAGGLSCGVGVCTSCRFLIAPPDACIVSKAPGSSDRPTPSIQRA